MKRRASAGNRAETVRAYWREVRAFAKDRGVSIKAARAAPGFRANYQSTGKAPAPRPTPRARPLARSKGTRGFVTGGRSKTVRSYWDFVNAYAAQRKMPPQLARLEPEFQRAYKRYRDALAAESRAKSDGERTEAKLQQLDALAVMGMITPEERDARKASPKFMRKMGAGADLGLSSSEVDVIDPGEEVEA